MDRLARALVERPAGQYEGWRDVVLFAARIGDIDTDTRTWTGHGGLVDKGTKGKRARKVPIIAEICELVLGRTAAVPEDDDDARLFYGPPTAIPVAGVARMTIAPDGVTEWARAPITEESARVDPTDSRSRG